MPDQEIIGRRTPHSVTYDTGQRSGAASIYKTMFYAAPIWTPDLSTRIDMTSTRLRGTDICYESLANGVRCVFDKNRASYTLIDGRKSMTYEGPVATRTSQSGNVVEYLTADGVRIQFIVTRSKVYQKSFITDNTQAIPSFRKIGSGFDLRKPEVRHPDTDALLGSGDVSFAPDGTILSGIDYAKLTPPFVVDPTSTFLSSTNDFRVSNTNAVFATCRSAASGNGINDATVAHAGEADLSGGVFFIQRNAQPFDTSSIGTSYTISAATLDLFHHSGVNNTDSTTAEVVKGSYGLPGVLADYSAFTNTSIGTKTFASFTIAVYNSITITDLTVINASGTTKLMVTTGLDVNNVAPTGNNDVSFHSADNTNPPRLTVTIAAIGDPGRFMLKGVI